jgi:hypothetical protein
MIYTYVEECFKNNDREKGIQALISVLELIKHRCQMGYMDKDGGISNNYGFIDGLAVQVDIGEVAHDESIKDPVNYLREILRVSQKIEVWLKAHFPDAAQD